MELNGIQSDLVTFNILINCYWQLGQNAFSFSALAKILKLGYHPDVFTLSTIMKGFCLKGEVHKALHFHDKVVADGFQLDHVSYGILIKGFM